MTGTIQSNLRACLVGTGTPKLAPGGVHFAVLPLDVNTWPAIVIAADMVTPENTVDNDNDEMHRFQIDLYAPSLSAVLGARAGVFSAITGQFGAAVRVSEVADYNADTKLHRRMIDYVIPDF